MGIFDGKQKVKDYPLKVMGWTQLIAWVAIIGLVSYNVKLGKSTSVWELLFPFGEPSVLILLWSIVGLLSGITVTAWQSKYRKKAHIVLLFICFALSCLAALTVSVIWGGGIQHSPFAAFFPVAIAVAIMSTSKPFFVVTFSIATVTCVIIAASSSTTPSIDPAQVSTHEFLYATGYVLALIIGMVAGSIRLEEDDDDNEVDTE